MRMTPALLLDEIEGLGGQITVLPDHTLLCQNIPTHLHNELQRLQPIVTAFLLGECEQRPRVVLNTRELRKLTKKIETAGGWFRPTGIFFSCQVPDELQHLTPQITDNADAIFHLLWPPKKSSRRTRT